MQATPEVYWYVLPSLPVTVRCCARRLRAPLPTITSSGWYRADPLLAARPQAPVPPVEQVVQLLVLRDVPWKSSLNSRDKSLVGVGVGASGGSSALAMLGRKIVWFSCAAAAF